MAEGPARLREGTLEGSQVTEIAGADDESGVQVFFSPWRHLYVTYLFGDLLVVDHGILHWVPPSQQRS